MRGDLTGYLVLAFGIAWGGVAAVHLSRLPTAWMFLPMLAAPPVAAVTVRFAQGGGDAVRSLLRGHLQWRAGARWYLVALGTAPVLALLALALAEALAGPAYRPGFSPGLLTIGLAAGIAEETGWSGYAARRLLARRPWPAAGLTLGVVWAVWHVAADLAGNLTAMGALWPAWFAVFWLAALPPYRMLMTLVMQRTGALPPAVLMHASYTGWLFCLSPPLPVQDGLLWQGLFAMLLWAAAGLAVLAEGHRARRTR